VYWDVTEVRIIGDHAIHVRFQDGLEGDVRFGRDFFRGVFAHLIDPERFRDVDVVEGAVTWPGELDLAPDAMHHEIKANGTWHVGGVQ
jgi:hypothetical protein